MKGFDYTQGGAYFITICTHDQECLMGEVLAEEMKLNDFGQIVDEEWKITSNLRPSVELDEYVIMPDHLHGIIILTEQESNAQSRGTLQRAPTIERFGKPTSNSIPTIVRLFKSASTARINKMRNMPGSPFWQRNYYERVIRNERELNAIRQYIYENPQRKWQKDSDRRNKNSRN
ncbi:MAG TPA: transposase [Bacteroidota bacterium]|nr:transposase [Bacteroidota bacterium]